MSYAVTNPATGETVKDLRHHHRRRARGRDRRSRRSAPHLVEVDHGRGARGLIRRVSELHRERRQELAELIVREMGKPIWAALSEVDFAADIYEYYADHSPDFLKDEPITLLAGEGSAVIRRSSLGVLLGVMPWNFPYYQVARFAGPNLDHRQHDPAQARRAVPRVRRRDAQIFLDAGHRPAPTGTSTPRTTSSSESSPTRACRASRYRLRARRRRGRRDRRPPLRRRSCRARRLATFILPRPTTSTPRCRTPSTCAPTTASELQWPSASSSPTSCTSPSSRSSTGRSPTGTTRGAQAGAQVPAVGPLPRATRSTRRSRRSGHAARSSTARRSGMVEARRRARPTGAGDRRARRRVRRTDVAELWRKLRVTRRQRCGLARNDSPAGLGASDHHRPGAGAASRRWHRGRHGVRERRARRWRRAALRWHQAPGSGRESLGADEFMNKKIDPHRLTPARGVSPAHRPPANGTSPWRSSGQSRTCSRP